VFTSTCVVVACSFLTLASYLIAAR
jgi:hypothetical protein